MNQRERQRGWAFVSVLLISTLLAIAGSSYLSLGSREAGLVREELASAQALYAAESGINYARRRLKAQSQWTGGDWSQTFETPQVNGLSGSVTVSFSYTDSNGDGQLGGTDRGTVVATGQFQGSSRTISAVFAPERATPFDQATCGCSEVNFNSASVTVDSYIYSPSGPGYISGSLGNVASNGGVELGGAEVAGSIIAGGDLSGNNGSQVFGDVTLGGDTEQMKGSIGGKLRKNQTPAPQPCACDAIEVAAAVEMARNDNDNSYIYSICPSCMSDGSSLENPGTEFSTNSDIELAPGTYYFSKFSIGGNAQVKVAEGGTVRIFLGDIRQDGSINSNQNKRFTFGGGGLANSYDNTANLKIYSASSADITLSGTSAFAGSIFAPAAKIKLSGTSDVYGAIIGDVSTILGTVNFHYDATLAEQSEPQDINTSVSLRTVSWNQD